MKKIKITVILILLFALVSLTVACNKKKNETPQEVSSIITIVIEKEAEKDADPYCDSCSTGCCVFSDSDERICKIRIVYDPISGHWIRYPEKSGKRYFKPTDV